MNIAENYIYGEDNRRGHVPVIEQLLVFEERELPALVQGAGVLLGSLASQLADRGLRREFDTRMSGHLPLEPRALFASLYNGLALSLQVSAGHRVQYCQGSLEEDPRQLRVMFEYEDEDVGLRASQLAHLLLKKACPVIEVKLPSVDKQATLASLLADFPGFARSRLLPVDTQAIIDAARRENIPCYKLDRYPLRSEVLGFRIRPNSPLRLGHGRYQHIVDGTFCVDRCEKLLPLLSDRERVMRHLHQLGLPVPTVDPVSQNCTTLSRAFRSADRISYPVIVKPGVRVRSGLDSTPVHNESELAPAHALASAHGRRVWLEQLVPGSSYKILFANGTILGVLSECGVPQNVTRDTHVSILDHASKVSQSLDTGVLLLTCVTKDISQPLEDVGGAFVDMDLAPELDSFLTVDSSLLRAAATGLVHWLFPQGPKSRIPLIAVTGTNGKTTTSRMIYSILNRSGRATGLACTDGVYASQGRAIVEGDYAGLEGHIMLLNSPEIDSAVLETARGGVLTRGFGFEHCDIAVCLNVTEDHLFEYGIETVEKMAAVKRTIVDRSNGKVVLNADDPLCMAMLPLQNNKEIGLVSMDQAINVLRNDHGDCHFFSVLEDINGTETIVIYDREKQVPIISVDAIPATFNGTAGHNVSNALHASMVCYLAGTASNMIQAALSSFAMSYESTPGRLNIYDQLPFRVILDYAHNPDGIYKLCQFIAQQEVKGRRLVAFSAAAESRLEVTLSNALAVASHFDEYCCFNYFSNIEKQQFHIPERLRHMLIEEGIPGGSVHTKPTGVEGTKALLQMAREGDLVVILSGHSDRKEIWECITGFKQGENPAVNAEVQEASIQRTFGSH